MRSLLVFRYSIELRAVGEFELRAVRSLLEIARYRCLRRFRRNVVVEELC